MGSVQSLHTTFEGGEAMSETPEVYRAGALRPEAEREAARAQHDDYAYAFSWNERAAERARREEHVDCPSPRGYIGMLARQMAQRIDKRRWANEVRQVSGLPRLTPEDSDYAQG